MLLCRPTRPMSAISAAIAACCSIRTDYRCAVIITRDRTILVTGASDAAPALEVVRDPSCIYRYGVFFFSGRGSRWPIVGDAEGKRHLVEALREALRATCSRSCHRRGRY